MSARESLLTSADADFVRLLLVTESVSVTWQRPRCRLGLAYVILCQQVVSARSHFYLRFSISVLTVIFSLLQSLSFLFQKKVCSVIVDLVCSSAILLSKKMKMKIN